MGPATWYKSCTLHSPTLARSLCHTFTRPNSSWNKTSFKKNFKTRWHLAFSYWAEFLLQIYHPTPTSLTKLKDHLTHFIKYPFSLSKSQEEQSEEWSLNFGQTWPRHLRTCIVRKHRSGFLPATLQLVLGQAVWQRVLTKAVFRGFHGFLLWGELYLFLLI